MTKGEYVSGLVAPYEPGLPAAQLVVELNKLYHACEARDYDSKHPEVHKHLPPLWKEMIAYVIQHGENRTWRVLDFGCGTGFEAQQLARNLPRGSIAGLICYDPCPEMLDRCRATVSSLVPKAVFWSNLESASLTEPCNLLVTNSVLHHLPDPVAAIRTLLPLLTPDAFWLAGHEPSNRFYRNAECVRAYERFAREHRWRRFLTLKNYVRRLQRAMGLESDPASHAAIEAFRKGLFKRKPSAYVVGRLVDLHVAHGTGEMESGRGLDLDVLQQELKEAWSLCWVRSYSFMGPFHEGLLPAKWVRLCRELARRFPDDGANFCSVWRRRQCL